MKIIQSEELINNTNHDFFRTTTLENIQGAEEIILDVKENGDDAVIKYSKQFKDGDFGSAEDFLVTEEEIEEAYRQTDSKTVEALKKSIKNVENKSIWLVFLLFSVYNKNQIEYRRW